MFNQIIISKFNLINNFRQVKLNNPNSKFCLMVKANAYGVGLTQVVKIAREFVDCFGVACLFEAKRVKRYTDLPILIVGPIEKKKPDNRFVYTCHSIEDVVFLSKYDIDIRVHLAVNSGMNRYGISSLSEFRQAIEIIRRSKIVLEGIFTHFANSDNSVEIQYKKFLKFAKIAKEYNSNVIVHTDNSVVNRLYNHHLDMVRIGFDVYYGFADRYKQVIQIKTKIVQLNTLKKGDMTGYANRFIAEQKTKVAVIPIGYADGFDMAYIGKSIYIKGKACRVLNVCMDCMMLDVTKVEIKKGDEIYLIDRFNSIKSYADFINSIEYEVMTKFSNLRASRKIVNFDLHES